MDRAVSQLDAIMKQKTSHSTKSILESMRALCAMAHLFTYKERQEAFGQMCRNFEITCEHTRRTSWGRNEFERWWNDQVAVTDNRKPGEFRQEYMGTPYQPDAEQPLPGYMYEREDIPPPSEPGEGYTDLYEANLRIAELEHQLQEMRWGIQRMIGIGNGQLHATEPPRVEDES